MLACTSELKQVNDSVISNENNRDIIHHGVSVRSINNEKILVFDTQEEFNKTLAGLSDFSSNRLRNSSITDNTFYTNINPLPEKTIQLEGFRSIYDDFANAMDEAESYYERPGGYEEFKKKIFHAFLSRRGR